jgi:hypothetical protein
VPVIVFFIARLSEAFFMSLLKMETMKLSEFILLSEEQKKQSVLHKGVLVAKRSRGDCLIFLFQLDNYYVETHCNRASGRITEYRVFHHLSLLMPYLEEIKIDGLL